MILAKTDFEKAEKLEFINQFLQNTKIEYKINLKSRCTNIDENHMILKFNQENHIEILALKTIFINEKQFSKNDGFQKLNNLDDIRIDSANPIPLIWKFI